MLTNHLVFSPKYRGKVLEGEVAEATEEIIRKTYKELDIEVIDMAVSVDHIHLFIKTLLRFIPNFYGLGVYYQNDRKESKSFYIVYANNET